MFRTALMSLDHSAAEGPLLECLSDLRDMGVSRVILVHVVATGYGQGASFGNKHLLEAWLDERAISLREAGLDVVVDIRAAGTVAKEILQAAAAHDADLIVIGSRGQSLARGLFLGSVARDVLRLSTLPVRLEWIDTAADDSGGCIRACHAGLQRVLLATDFSQAARVAESAAIALASRAKTIDLVHVLSADELTRFAHWPIMARAALDAVAAEIEAKGGQAEVHLIEGPASQAIAEVAEARAADLIVIGKNGQNWAQSMVIGSTAAALCEIARRPVLMVPTVSK